MTDDTMAGEHRENLGSRLIEPSDACYDEARRGWNAMIDRKPAAIAACESTEDVRRAVLLAQKEKLPLTIRCGGHSVSGQSIADGALLIDLAGLGDIAVDAEARIARVGGGAKLGDLDKATQAHSLGVTAGVEPSTGAGGLTLGGGIGFLARRQGLTIDHMIGAEVVLADGSVVEANENDHADLFWALRGGGGRFGVVTRFDFAAYPVGPEITTAQVFYPHEQARQVLARYRDFIASAPDEIGCYALFVHVPEDEAFPKDAHGSVSCALVASHVGDVEAGQEALAELTRWGDPLFELVAPIQYIDFQTSFADAAPAGGRYYWKSHFLADLTEEVIDIVTDHCANLPGPYTNAFFEAMGGAAGRIAPDATAFPHREALFNFGIAAGWDDPAGDEKAIAWTRVLFEALKPHATGGVYANYLDGDEDDRVADAFAANFERLRAVKREYDPDGVFGRY